MNTDREPWWKVNAIFDPEGGGADFSYTVGLAERGLPELHMWARPSLGDDPGSDWHFSLRDTCRILNQVSWRLIDGELTPGTTWEESFDEGYVTTRFAVGDLVEADDVDAFEVSGRPVLPVHWELVRPSIGPPRELTEPEMLAARAEYDGLCGRLEPDSASLGPWTLPAEPRWGAGQRFGPRTPLVIARAAEIQQAGADGLIGVLDQAIITDQVCHIPYALLVARAAAREPGRTWALEQVEADAEALASDFGVTWGVPESRAVRDWMATDDGSVSDDHWRQARDYLVEAISTCLVVEAMADLLPDHVVTLGQGVVRTAIGPQGQAPDARWACSESVARAVRRLVTSTPVEALVAVAAAWHDRHREPDCWSISARRWTGACYPPVVFDYLGRERAALSWALLAERGLPPVVLQEWAGSLATILTHRVVVGEAAVSAFLRCGPRVPGLARLVNSPILAAS